MSKQTKRLIINKTSQVPISTVMHTLNPEQKEIFEEILDMFELSSAEIEYEYTPIESRFEILDI